MCLLLFLAQNHLAHLETFVTTKTVIPLEFALFATQLSHFTILKTNVMLLFFADVFANKNSLHNLLRDQKFFF